MRIVIGRNVSESPSAPGRFRRWKYEIIAYGAWQCRGYALTRWGAERKADRIANRISKRRLLNVRDGRR